MSRKTRKLIWSAPLVAAIAVVGALTLFMALSPNGAQADHVDLPGIVTDVVAEAEGRDSVEVTWEAAATGGTPDHYRIDRSENGDVWMRLVMMHTDGRSYTDDTVKPMKTYHYRVFGVNAAGTGPSSDLTVDSMTTTSDAVRPGPVRMLTASAMGPNQINLSWYPPEDDGGADVTRYCIATAGITADTNDTDGVLPVPDPATPTQFTDATNDPCAHDTAPTGDTRLTAIRAATGAGVIVIRAPEGDGKVQYAHVKLAASNERRYEVYAVNEKGFSETASAASPRPSTADAGKPGRPLLRAVVNDADSTVDLYWTWPADNGGAAIQNFAVDTKSGSDPWDSADGTINSPNDAVVPVVGAALSDPELDISAAITATTSYRVRANNGTKTSDWSNTVTIRFSNGTLSTDPPDAVENLSASQDDHLRQIDLKWDDESNTSYFIDVSTDNGLTWMSVQGNTGYTRSTYNHSGLKPDSNATNDDATDYKYRVFSFSSGAYGAAATAQGSTIQARKPQEVRGLKTSSDDPTEILLEWDKPSENGGYEITGYRVEISAYDGFEDPSTGRVPVTHPLEDCETPAGTTGTEDGFCAREVDGGDNTMYLLEGLSAGDERWFRVFAINKVSEDDTGDTGTPANDFPDTDDIRLAEKIKGTSAKSGTPGMPLDLTVQPARDANEDDPAKLGIDILWNAPDDPAGDTVTGYVIARRTKDSTDAAWSAWDEDWGEIERMVDNPSDFLRTHFTDTDEPDNLANGEMREYRVTAKSGAGSGLTTDAVVYPVDTSHAPVSTELTAPTNVMTSSTVAREMMFTWEGGDNAENYILVAVDIAAYDAGTLQYETASVSGDVDPKEGKVSNLTSGTQYLGLVFSAKGIGTSDQMLLHAVADAPTTAQ